MPSITNTASVPIRLHPCLLVRGSHWTGPGKSHPLPLAQDSIIANPLPQLFLQLCPLLLCASEVVMYFSPCLLWLPCAIPWRQDCAKAKESVPCSAERAVIVPNHPPETRSFITTLCIRNGGPVGGVRGLQVHDCIAFIQAIVVLEAETLWQVLARHGNSSMPPKQDCDGGVTILRPTIGRQAISNRQPNTEAWGKVQQGKAARLAPRGLLSAELTHVTELVNEQCHEHNPYG
ncbi:hypothetical protein BU25DRAFT_424858 [Macroventuria anomochaeta]|uniref:Uncharacterized protein n=1 Tax=Macroventuria anomochaeta TaxID=301207 RepID=A0ACB6RN32_9PLEO|nr:uncharacterized protein BU25DRAFT_424858 [Macroventuria anomochaeta]KAF2623336.1 hypothetical protein BU25DRAFT_424858 [Macroventuria anomochaeta]